MAIKALITDLDGTLCDTRMANTVSYEQAFKDAHLEFSRNDYDEAFGLRFEEMFDILAPQATDEQRRTVKSQKQIHYANNLDLVNINEGLVTILKDAKAEGKKLALATTAQSANAIAVLKYFSLYDLFDEMIFGEEVAHGKPDPECYTTIIKRLGISPSECLIFEDSDAGIQAAEASGASVEKVVL